MVRPQEALDDSRWEESDVSAALEHYIGLDRCSIAELEARLGAAGVLDRVPVPDAASEQTRFQVMALALQDVWLAERFAARSEGDGHFARLRARFFAALRVLGEHGPALEKSGLVILDPERPWIAPILAQAIAGAAIRMDASGVPMLVMPGAE